MDRAAAPWLLAVVLAALAPLAPSQARAQTEPSVSLSFVPADRTQIAVWIERADGSFLKTLALTYAVANAGIGNRPGALQMNSGFRWPYGRREGVLPVWAHARAGAPDAKPFRRVIFQDRTSEGFASRSVADYSRDTYYCLSFSRAASHRDALDAVTCPSVFSSDKGRYITQADVDQGYSEPFEATAGEGAPRPLSFHSLYPPRRDVSRCRAAGCYDHADVDDYASHALEVLPELDAITRATPEGQKATTWTFSLPSDWPDDQDYVLYVEANVEGDYNSHFNDRELPTPTTPSAAWDKWAKTFGYPYRGQPSVVYGLPFRLDEITPIEIDGPLGSGALHGEDGALHPLDQITDDPQAAPGSGADRLMLRDGVRASLRVTLADPCLRDDPPEPCGQACNPDAEDACEGLFCSRETRTCASYCAATAPAPEVDALAVERHPDRLKAHTWALLAFRVPESERPLASYEVRLRPEGGAWEQAFTPDTKQADLPVALDLCSRRDAKAQPCAELDPATRIEAVIAGLKPSTRYQLEVRARDERCGELGAAARTEFTTPARTFATVSPCFVATAAYGSALAAEVEVLRAFRDRHLAPHALGRAFIAAYYRIGPRLADLIRPRPWLKAWVRATLGPVVSLARWWMDGDDESTQSAP